MKRCLIILQFTLILLSHSQNLTSQQTYNDTAHVLNDTLIRQEAVKSDSLGIRDSLDAQIMGTG
ncbi:MAG: hypothetical protein JSV24_03360, partial [Bacteroidales bacterium]